jgi:hypothetical protein
MIIYKNNSYMYHLCKHPINVAWTKTFDDIKNIEIIENKKNWKSINAIFVILDKIKRWIITQS